MPTLSAQAHFVFWQGEVLSPTDCDISSAWSHQRCLITLQQTAAFCLKAWERKKKKECASRWCSRWKLCMSKSNSVRHFHTDVCYWEHWKIVIWVKISLPCLVLRDFKEEEKAWQWAFWEFKIFYVCLVTWAKTKIWLVYGFMMKRIGEVGNELVECNTTLNNKFMICRIFNKKKSLGLAGKNTVSGETINQPNFCFGLVC